jgi:hypothetical protein
LHGLVDLHAPNYVTPGGNKKEEHGSVSNSQQARESTTTPSPNAQSATGTTYDLQ